MRNIFAILILTLALDSAALGKVTRVGVAKLDITPTHPTLLAGYGGRVGEHVAVDMKLWARAIVLGQENPVLLVAVDNCGVPAKLTKGIQRALKSSLGLAPEQIVICSTHTHNAPSLTGYAPVVWGSRVTEQQQLRSDRYTQWFVEKVLEVSHQAFHARQPATLHWGQGQVNFGGNRRVLSEGRWTGFGFQTNGPVDHSVPVMVARSAEGKPIAIWTNYACHCTAEGSRNHISGDWAGNANLQIEKQHPSAIALTTIGCGADIGPQPSGSQDIAKQHGQTLADEVSRLVALPLKKISCEVKASDRQFDIPLSTPAPKEHYEEHAQGEGFEAERSRLVLAYEKEHGKIQTHVPYTITCWKFDQDLAIVFMAGEVVVDYAVRLKTQLDWKRLWLNAWSNDVPSYIPSRRVLQEGGYEPGFSQTYYGLPSPYSPAIEDLILKEVVDLVGEEFENPDPDQPAPDFLKQPSATQQFIRSIDRWYDNLDQESKSDLKSITSLAEDSINGVEQLLTKDPATASWFNFSGLHAERPFIRQTDELQRLSWKTSASAKTGTKSRFLFAGGLGWSSQPKTDGFEVLLNGKAELKIDVSLTTTAWESPGKQVRLDYLVTWSSDTDSAGLFYLTVPNEMLDKHGQLTIEVHSLGTGSLRWFSVDNIRNVKEVEQAIIERVEGR